MGVKEPSKLSVSSATLKLNTNEKTKLASPNETFQTNTAGKKFTDEKVTEIHLTELHSFKNHPFRVRDDDLMTDTIESIKKYGVLVPAIARPLKSGGYELIAGHRRKRACELAGLDKMPVIIREPDDDEAVIMMADSNLQRETLLPSERAFTYKIKLEAVKRQAEKNSKDNPSQVGTNKRSDQILAEQSGESRNQIHRYIRLTELIPELLDLTDNKKIAFNPATELSYLTKDEQILLFDIMKKEEATPSLSQAQRLKKLSQSGKLTPDIMDAIISEEKKEVEKIIFKGDMLSKYFPKSFTPKQIEDTIIKLLENWFNNQHRTSAQ